jgi:RHS repeat-associated protein
VPSTRAFYRPFGEFAGTAPRVDKSGGRQFTSKELDATGLYDFGARAYDPVTGSFLQGDEIDLPPGGQTRNRYSYVLNNPLRQVDPTGHRPELYDIPEEMARNVRAKCDSCALMRPQAQGWSSYFMQGNRPIGEIWDLPDRAAQQAVMDYVGFVPIELSTSNIEYREELNLTVNAYRQMIPVVASLATPSFSGITPTILGAKSSSYFLSTVKAGPRLFSAGVTEYAALYAEVAQLHTMADSIAIGQRTTSVVRAVSGEGAVIDVFAAGAQRDLSPLQRGSLIDPAQVAARLPGADAEMTNLFHISNQPGWQPRIGIAFGRDVCPNCRFMIEEAGGIFLNDRVFVFPTGW